MSIKALLIGFFATLFMGLTFELVFLFLDVSYNYLMKIYPVIVPFKQAFYFLIIIPGFFIVMFTGGYLTSIYTPKHALAHSVAVALMVCGVALYSTNSGYEMTWFGLAFIVLGVVFTLIGYKTWKKNALKTPHDPESMPPVSSVN